MEKLEKLALDSEYLNKTDGASLAQQDFADLLAEGFRPELPLTRVVNGFRLVPEFVAPLFDDFRVIWKITPFRSIVVFCFASLSSAESFAHSYKNCHTTDFWTEHWLPVFAFDNVVKYCSYVRG